MIALLATAVEADTFQGWSIALVSMLGAVLVTLVKLVWDAATAAKTLSYVSTQVKEQGARLDAVEKELVGLSTTVAERTGRHVAQP